MSFSKSRHTLTINIQTCIHATNKKINFEKSIAKINKMMMIDLDNSRSEEYLSLFDLSFYDFSILFSLQIITNLTSSIQLNMCTREITHSCG
jgi:hypothetical protein